MTDVDQVEHAVSQGVDAIGVILHANSPRKISLEQARLIRASVPAFVSLVGVFVDADHAQIERMIDLVGLDMIQLHGCETESFALSLSRPYIKAVRAQSRAQVLKDCAMYPSASGLLLDPYVEGQHGGTGRPLEMSLWPNDAQSDAFILAGGLSPQNVGERIRQLSPYAVDLNSGVENSPGRKDPDLVAQAVREVRNADS